MRHVEARGLIPAHAGKTYSSQPTPCISRAHPRSRGENVPLALDHPNLMGSSPLTRGKQVVELEGECHRGLIPAHAGKILQDIFDLVSAAAHPRSRGENLRAQDGTAHHQGSSPLTRGKHFLTCAFIAQIGQILESLELCASSESYSLRDAYATDALRDQVRSIGLVPLSSRGAS